MTREFGYKLCMKRDHDLPVCVMPLCVMPLCVMPVCVFPLCVMPVCMMPFRDRSLFIAWGGAEDFGGDHMVF